jgi:hypothetical protein
MWKTIRNAPGGIVIRSPVYLPTPAGKLSVYLIIQSSDDTRETLAGERGISKGNPQPTVYINILSIIISVLAGIFPYEKVPGFWG